jgi:lysophospholipase L1-like esterase
MKTLLAASVCLFSTWLSVATADTAARPIAVSPAPRLENYAWMSLARWYEMHSEDVELAYAGESPLLFIGDSITEGWEHAGRTHWEAEFAPRGAVDFGIGGDMTQNLLWRLANGAAGTLDPKAVVLLIGINNTGFTGESSADIAQGVIAVVDTLQSRFPDADILLQAVFPHGEQADHPQRARVKEINQGIQHLGQREKVTYMDLGPVFLEPDGSLSTEVMPDFLHLSGEGYRRWAEAIRPWVDERVPMPAESLPHAFDAGWKGQKTCQVVFENPSLRVGHCAFPAGVGHEKHYHNPHWGYVLEGSTLKIIDAGGERELTTQTGSSWETTERTVHEAVNIDDHETSYIIVEPR